VLFLFRLPVTELLSFSSFFFQLLVRFRSLHCFPTRRSSDLIVPLLVSVFAPSSRATTRAASIEVSVIVPALVKLAEAFTIAWLRSEEHTSELQSRGQLARRLLHEKKILIVQAPAPAKLTPPA